MKMKAGTRVIFTIYMLVMVVLCLFLLCVTLGMLDSSLLQGAVNTLVDGSAGFKVLYTVVLVVLVIVGVALMFFGTKKETPKTARIAEFESGSIFITVKAIEELVEKFVRDTSHVKGTNIRVVSYTDSIDISVEISVKPDVDIPELTQKMQTGLSEYIQQNTGIAVRNSKIMVMEIDDALKTRVE